MRDTQPNPISMLLQGPSTEHDQRSESPLIPLLSFSGASLVESHQLQVQCTRLNEDIFSAWFSSQKRRRCWDIRYWTLSPPAQGLCDKLSTPWPMLEIQGFLSKMLSGTPKRHLTSVLNPLSMAWYSLDGEFRLHIPEPSVKTTVREFLSSKTRKPICDLRWHNIEKPKRQADTYSKSFDKRNKQSGGEQGAVNANLEALIAVHACNFQPQNPFPIATLPNLRSKKSKRALDRRAESREI